MKLNFCCLALAGALVVGAGCVDTVAGGKAGGFPVQDTMSGRYERPLEQVFEAAKEVVKFNGTLVKESVMHTETNMVKTVEGRINQRNVFVRVESMDPKVTQVLVQTRTQGGGSDLPLAHEIEKQIAIKLTTK